MSIRPYADSDLDAVLNLWYRASKVAHSFLPDDFFERERREIATLWLPMAETIVFDVDNRVDGFLALIGNEVGAIFVDPEAQGQGIGRNLMESVKSRRQFLELSVLEANEAGRRFYDAYGFELVACSTCDRTCEPQLRLRLDCPRFYSSG